MTAVAAPTTSPFAKAKAYWELGKPRLSSLAVFAVVAGVFMAWPKAPNRALPAPPWEIVVLTTVGTFLAAAGASALNMYRERDLDALMVRTRERPLPSGRLEPRAVLAFGVATATAGVLLVLLQSLPRGFVNWSAGALCAAIVVSYVLVYTPMKRRTPLNTLVGAIPGALPPVVGYAAVRGEFEPPQLVLFAILFCWQIPHFLAIAWRYRDDYARAGMRMLPVVDPSGARTTTTMLLYVAGLGIASFLPYFFRMSGERYAAAAFCLNVLFFVPAVIAALTRRDTAMRMTFQASIVYLPLLLVAMVWDKP